MSKQSSPAAEISVAVAVIIFLDVEELDTSDRVEGGPNHFVLLTRQDHTDPMNIQHGAVSSTFGQIGAYSVHW